MIVDNSTIRIVNKKIDCKYAKSKDGLLWEAGKRIEDYPIGTKVIDPNTKYNGSPIEWLIVAKDHPSYLSNSVTLISDKILTFKAFDAAEPDSTDRDIQSRGNNRYIYSNILQWLNKTDVDWFVKQHSTDYPPVSSYVSENEYRSEAGFLNGFSKEFLDSLLITKSKVNIAATTSVENSEQKLFLPSVTEVGLTYTSMEEDEGYPIPLLTDNKYRIAESTDNRKGAWYWTRTPDHYRLTALKRVMDNGGLDTNNAYGGNGGVRPMCNVRANAICFEETKWEENLWWVKI